MATVTITETAVTKTKAQQWEENYQAVLKFAKQNGHLKLPRKNPKTRRLANWLGRQKVRKDMSNSEREKIAVLSEYGYINDYSRNKEEDEIWNKYFDYYVEYKRVVGRSVVPKDDDHRKLSEWIARQRKMKKEGRLRVDRERKLVDIGFVFVKNKPYVKKKRYTSDQQKKWDEMYNQLCHFYKQHGHCKVSFNDTNHEALSKWVSVQRVAHGKGLMDKSRQQRLDEICFAWTIKNTSSAR